MGSRITRILRRTRLSWSLSNRMKLATKPKRETKWKATPRQKMLNAQSTSLLRKVSLKILVGIVSIGMYACTQRNEDSPTTEHPVEIVSEIDRCHNGLDSSRYISDGFHNRG